jgi:hypothetical protein
MRAPCRRWRRLTAIRDRVVLDDLEVGATPPATQPPDPEPALRRIAAETVILQDEAEQVLRDIRARQGLGYIAPRAGPLVRRFFALRDQLPTQPSTLAQSRIRDEMAVILHHHAMALSVAMDFLANEWRSAALADQVDALTDLGPPARRFEEIYRLLARPA